MDMPVTCGFMVGSKAILVHVFFKFRVTIGIKFARALMRGSGYVTVLKVVVHVIHLTLSTQLSTFMNIWDFVYSVLGHVISFAFSY